MSTLRKGSMVEFLHPEQDVVLEGTCTGFGRKNGERTVEIRTGYNASWCYRRCIIRVLTKEDRQRKELTSKVWATIPESMDGYRRTIENLLKVLTLPQLKKFIADYLYH